MERHIGRHYLTEEDDIVLLRELVSIDSQVNNNNGIQMAQEFLKEKLEALKFNVKFHKNPEIESAPLIIAKRSGRSDAPTVTFIGHSDVVTKPSQVKFKVENHRIYGAGVADDKGGLVVCIRALKNFLKKIPNHNLNLNIVISPNEETGSIGFHKTFHEIGMESDYVFGLEPALSCGSIITSRSGNRWYHIHINGISAHSGRFGNKYINAAHKLSLLIAQMHELNDEKMKKRVNVGSFSGGNGGFNTICGKSWAKVDVRFSSFDCRDFLHQQIENIISQTSISCPYSGQLSHALYSIEDDCPPLAAIDSDMSWFCKYQQEIKTHEGLMTFGKHAGGAADINYFASPGKQILDGMGPVGGGMHTPNEYIERNSLATRMKALQELLVWLNKQSS